MRQRDLSTLILPWLSLLPAVTTALPWHHISGDALPANEITINSVYTSGSGCPRRAVTISISADRTYVTLGFDEFQTYIGPGYRNHSTTERDKLCEIHLNVHVPGGYTYAVLDATYHGFAQMDAGVTGSIETQYSFGDGSSGRGGGGGGKDTCGTKTSIQGGGVYVNGQEYTKQDVIPTAEVVRSPCGTNSTLLVKTRINLAASNSSASGSMTEDDATFAFTHQMHLGWQTCKSS